MLKFIDNFLNKTTMYLVVLYVLIFFFCSVVLLSALKFLPYSPLGLTISLFIILFASYIFNTIFSYLYDAPTNTESVYITALILFFIITPVIEGMYLKFLPIALLVSLYATVSKYIFAIRKKHIFNPAAISLVLLAFTINEPGSWWIGAPIMLPFIILAGLLITRKIRHMDLVLSFITSVLATIFLLAILKSESFPNIFNS